jgi:hypothetical protein
MLFSRKRNEIRHKRILFLLIPLLFGFTFEAIIFHNLWQMLFPIIISIFIILIYVKNKLVFDDLGISFYNIWGHKYQVLWKDILLVEDTYEDPRLSRGSPGRIVKIVYKNHKGKTEIAKYSYTNYVGLTEFLSYYYAKESTKSPKNVE